jgi:hypothetical protein
MARIEREGYLMKKSYLNYKARYFVLEGSNLFYKASKEEYESRGVMTLGADTQIIEFPAKRGQSWVRPLPQMARIALHQAFPTATARISTTYRSNLWGVLVPP